MKQRANGEGCLYQRVKGQGVWWMKFYRDGKAYFASTKETDKEKAEKILKRKLASVLTGTFVAPRVEKIRVNELAEGFLRDYKINGLKLLDDATARWNLHLKPVFGHLRAVQVTTDALNNYVDKRQTEGAANATINRELAALKRMFVRSWCASDAAESQSCPTLSTPRGEQHPEGICRRRAVHGIGESVRGCWALAARIV